jgi:hypothetical protein
MEDFVEDEEVRRSTADDLLDELLPEGLDWQRLVRAYPIPAVLLAALGGFLLGRSHGPAIASAVSGFAAAEVAKNVSHAIEREIG